MYVHADVGSVFTLFYCLFCTGFILQFGEFASVGLSPENLLQRFIKCSEEIQPIEFHMRKSAYTLILHASLPMIYILGLAFFTAKHSMYLTIVSESQWMLYGLIFTATVPLMMAWGVRIWAMDNWAAHPFARKLAVFGGSHDWQSVANDINTEFRRIDKFVIKNSPISKVAVTDHWILYLGQYPWNLKVAHQSDQSIALSLVDSRQHEISAQGQSGGAQYLTIQVNARKSGSFSFRLNSLEYQNLTDKVTSTVNNARNVRIIKSVHERFVEVFRDEVERNPKAQIDDSEEVDQCIGCMVNRSNVKLVRRCDSEQEQDSCATCYCRPMWCLDCLGKWFASRQNQNEPETWLGSKCPCPTCRSKFCLLDISIIP